MFVDVRNDFSAEKRVCIAVAKDEAFSFYYPTSLEYLEKMEQKLLNLVLFGIKLYRKRMA